MARESSHHARIGGARIARLSRSTVRRGGSARGSRCRPASDFRPVMSAARISCNKKAPSITAALPRTARERVVGILECGDGGVREAVRTHFGLEGGEVARHGELLAAACAVNAEVLLLQLRESTIAGWTSRPRTLRLNPQPGVHAVSAMRNRNERGRVRGPFDA